MPLILTSQEAEARFRISNYDPINALHYDNILLFETSTSLSGDFNTDWIRHAWQAAGAKTPDIGNLLVVVNGDLHVTGDIVFNDYLPSLLILGNVTCHVLQSADECMHITGDAKIRYAYYGYYNDGTITIAGKTQTPYVLNSDHDSQIKPEGATLINVYSDDDDFFEYDYTVKDLPEVMVPEVLDNMGHLKVWSFISLLKAGKSPFKEGAKTRKQVFEEKLEKLLQEDPLAMTELDLSDQKLKTFPAGLVALQNLKVLKLSDNALKVIPDDIGQLTQLEELYLNTCALSSISPAIGHLKNLRVLELNSNRDLTTLPGTIAQLHQLQRLKIDYINLDFSSFRLPENLEEISMYSCFTDAIFPAQLAQLKNLKKLDLRKNSFQSMPLLPYLEELHWTDSSTESPLPDFSQCKSLKKLVISKDFNGWKNIVFNITSLEYLRIDRNKEDKQYIEEDMMSIWKEMAAEDPKKFAFLSKAVKEPDGRYSILIRKGVTPEELEGLARLTHLKHLDLSFNHLKTLPDSVYGLSTLEYLDLEYNQLSEAEKEKINHVFKHATVKL